MLDRRLWSLGVAGIANRVKGLLHCTHPGVHTHGKLDFAQIECTALMEMNDFRLERFLGADRVCDQCRVGTVRWASYQVHLLLLDYSGSRRLHHSGSQREGETWGKRCA